MRAFTQDWQHRYPSSPPSKTLTRDGKKKSTAVNFILPPLLFPSLPVSPFFFFSHPNLSWRSVSGAVNLVQECCVRASSPQRQSLGETKSHLPLREMGESCFFFKNVVKFCRSSFLFMCWFHISWFSLQQSSPSLSLSLPPLRPVESYFLETGEEKNGRCKLSKSVCRHDSKITVSTKVLICLSQISPFHNLAFKKQTKKQNKTSSITICVLSSRLKVKYIPSLGS